MRQRHDKVPGIPDQMAIHQVSPKLLGDLKLLIDLDGFADIYGSVRSFNGVVKFAQGGMPGSRVVPFVRTFLPRTGELLKNRDLPVRR
ncbi:hypothetical protein D1872_252380 [compost metagenome]